MALLLDCHWIAIGLPSLEAEMRCKVFLDSDEREALDLIFDTVRVSSKNVVVLHTKMTFSRPWFAKAQWQSIGDQYI